jgi:hypothetical protein
MGGLPNKAMKTGLDMGKRHLAGESLAFQHLTADGDQACLFAGALPGHMRCSSWTGRAGTPRRTRSSPPRAR